MNPEKMTREELIEKVEASRSISFRLFVSSLDGYIGVSKVELVRTLKLFVGPEACRDFTVMVTPKLDYVWHKEVWHIQGVWMPTAYMF